MQKKITTGFLHGRDTDNLFDQFFTSLPTEVRRSPTSVTDLSVCVCFYSRCFVKKIRVPACFGVLN